MSNSQILMDTRQPSRKLSNSSTTYGKKYFQGRVKPKVRVINIGPDPPGMFKRYIWGRTGKCYKFQMIYRLAIQLQ